MKESEVKWEAKIEEMWTLIEKAKTAKCEGSKQPTVGGIDQDDFKDAKLAKNQTALAETKEKINHA